VGRTKRSPAFMVAVAGVYVALAAFSAYWLGVITDHELGADFKIYYEAYLEAVEGGNPYEPYDVGDSFIYHPFALTLVSLFAWPDNTFSAALRGWVAGSLIAWIVAIGLTLRVLARHRASEKLSPAHKVWGSFLFLAFAPFWETLQIGQINAFVVLALCAVFDFAERGRQYAAGCALALALVLKSSPVVLLLYFVVNRHYRAIVATVAGVVVLSVVAALQFTPQLLWDFAAITPLLGREIHPTPYNQSLLSLAFRVLEAGGFPAASWVPALVVAHKALFALLLGLLVLAALMSPPRGDQRLALFLAMLTLTVFFSPLVWYHHAALLLLPLGALIWHPSPRRQVGGLVLLLLVQSNRLFEYTVVWMAFPALVAEAMLLAFWFGQALQPVGPFWRRFSVASQG